MPRPIEEMAAQIPPPSPGVRREGVGCDREAEREHRGPAEALDQPRPDQHLLAGRERSDHRADGEDDDAADEHPSPAQDVAQPPAGDHRRGEHQEVRVLHPLQAGLGQAEVLVDDRQRQHDLGRVEHEHEQPQARPTSTHHVRPGLIRRTELDWPIGG